MNKKLLAAAIAASVVAAPAAFAESVVYGKFHTSIDNYDVEEFDTTTQDNWEINSRASRLGFKGSEDLGNGLKAIYQAEFSVSTDGESGSKGPQSAGDGWGSQRNTFIGLAGDFGTVLVGRHDTPAKVALYAAGTEVLGDSIIDVNGGSTVGVLTEVRANNAIAYVSPNFSGFTVAAAVIPGEESGVGSNQSDGLADHWSLGAMYSGNGLKASLGYEKFDNQGDATVAGGVKLSDLGLGLVPAGDPETDIKLWQAGASYTMNNFMVGAHYQDTTVDLGNLGSKDLDYTAWLLSAKATFGNNAIMAIYTDASGEIGSTDIMDFSGWGLAAEHNFSKRTKVYAAYADADEDETDSSETSFSLGMIHSF